MTEVIRERDIIAASSQNGWTVEYVVRRDDGELVKAIVSCPGISEALAAHRLDSTLAEVVADRGKGRAIAMAESAQSGRGVRITIECIGEHVLARHHYEAPLLASSRRRWGFVSRASEKGRSLARFQG